MIKEKDNFLKNKYFVTTIIVLLVSGITICFATNQALPETNVNYEEKIENQQDINFQTNENFVENSILNLIVNPLETLKVTAEYGTRIHPITKAEIIHDGVDLKAEKGEKVMAAMDGVIEETDYNSENGNYIIIKHENAAEIKYTYYAHLSEIEVEEGDFVEAGTEIGKAGNTGKSTGPHLHFKVMNEQKESIDPSTILEF